MQSCFVPDERTWLVMDGASRTAPNLEGMNIMSRTLSERISAPLSVIGAVALLVSLLAPAAAIFGQPLA